ncbi:hypothetical protein IWQ60_006076 [Tieghemiomyces parasiticus]|uniref:CCHC-type domain-containing protein n=1 Tax=Tieghemiomyces parasiticus TaxID=78921 RepID=A0A9W8DSI0_9FUNG|nr:hypothetical protein IWQ60_006076 [Tieghemiomyces parasiticus]
MSHNAGSIQEPSKLLQILVKSLSQNQTKGAQWLPGTQLMPFAGTRRENIEYWLLSVDLYCEAQSIRNDHRKVMLAASALQDKALGKCYNCGLDGHMTRQCTKPRKQVNAIEEGKEEGRDNNQDSTCPNEASATYLEL